MTHRTAWMVFIMMLSAVSSQFQHGREPPLNRLYKRLMQGDLKRHAYHHSSDNSISRFPDLDRVDLKIRSLKTTTSSPILPVVMAPLHATASPFDSELLADEVNPEEAVMLPKQFDLDVIGNELNVLNEETSTATPSTVRSHPHHHHRLRHHQTTTVKSHEEHKIRNKEEVLAKFNEHTIKMKDAVKCSRPLPKVVHVSQVHPDTAKSYTPLCTIIHQCGEETGCCSDVSQACAVMEKETISLPFLIYNHVTGEQSMEFLNFENHTKCQCQHKKETKSRWNRDSTTPSPVKVCPSKYSVRLLADGTSLCDCFHMDQNCIQLKKGKGYFSAKDVKCINNEHCLLPACEYGHYLHRYNRCVRKKEMFTHWPKKSGS